MRKGFSIVELSLVIGFLFVLAIVALVIFPVLWKGIPMIWHWAFN